MNRRTTPHHRPAFTLMEALVAIVILAIAVPVNLFVLRDNLSLRSEGIKAERAYWLVSSLAEQITADVWAGTAELSESVLADFSAYVNDPATGLLDRHADSIAEAAAVGVSVWITQIDEPRVHTDDLGDPHDVRHLGVAITATWTDRRGEPLEWGVTLVLDVEDVP